MHKTVEEENRLFVFMFVCIDRKYKRERTSSRGRRRKEGSEEEGKKKDSREEE